MSPLGWRLQPLEIHETVAECMIFANHCVARRVYEAFPSAALVSTSHRRTACTNLWQSHHPYMLPWLPLVAAASSPRARA